MNASILLWLTLVAAEPTPPAPDAAATPPPAASTGAVDSAAADPKAGAPASVAAPADAKVSAAASTAAPADPKASAASSTAAPAEAPPVSPPAPTPPAPATAAPAEPAAPVAPVPEPAPATASPPPAAPAATATAEPAPVTAPATAAPGALPPATGAAMVAPAAEAVCAPPPEKKEGLSFLGLAYEMGFPQGMTAGLVVRPWGWLRIMGGVSTYGVGTGFHGEISLAPLRWYISMPILSVSAGRYASLDLSTIPGLPKEMADLVGASTLQYVSVMTGFEFGNQRHGMLSIQFGVTRMEVEAPGTATFASDPVSGSTAATIEMSGASVKSLFPAFKLGWTIFL